MENYVAKELAKNFLKKCDLLGLTVGRDAKSEELTIVGDPSRVQAVSAELQCCPDIKSGILQLLKDEELKAEKAHSLEFEVHNLADVIEKTQEKLDSIISALNNTSGSVEEIQAHLEDISVRLCDLVDGRDD